MNKAIFLLSILACSFLQPVFAQEIMNAELNATPLAINPAFTGMFNGCDRTSIIYSNHSSNSAIPYITAGASTDLPIFTDNKGNFLAAGIQFIRDNAGDGNITSFNGMLSLAYHKFFRKNASNNHHSSDLAFGLQAGYSQSSIDLSEIYFGHYNTPVFVAGTGAYHLGIGNTANEYVVNGGICFSHEAGDHFNYTIGLAGYNLNLPYNNTENTQYRDYGIDRRYIGEIGADWMVTSRLTLRLKILYQSQSNTNGITAGNEFHFKVSKPASYYDPISLFAGAWYHTSNSMMITSGIQFKRLQISFSYDFNYAPLYYYEYGSGGFAASVKYVFGKQRSLNRKRTISGTSF